MRFFALFIPLCSLHEFRKVKMSSSEDHIVGCIPILIRLLCSKWHVLHERIIVAYIGSL